MEIIHVVLGKANPDRMNGVNKVVHELSGQQVMAGHKVCIWGICSDLAHNYPPRRCQTRLFLKGRFPFSLPGGMKAAIAAASPGAVFHLHGGFLPQLYAVATALHREGRHFVCTPHGSYNVLAMKKNRFVKMLYRAFFEIPMLRKAGAVHVLGQSETDVLRTWVPSRQISIIPYGYDAPAPLREGQGKAPGFAVGYCGRIDIYTKGLDALLKGFALLQARHSDCVLHILGDGREMQHLRKMAAGSPAAQHILLYGAKYGAEKQALLEQFDVFAHPSRNEGMPAAVLEAAAAGIPCLVTKATNTGVAMEQYGAGVVIDQAEAHAVYLGLEQLYDAIVLRQQAAALRSSAQRMLRGAFSWPALLEQYIAMYQNALL